MSSGATAEQPSTYCMQCGKPLQFGASFCTACGTAIGLVKTQIAESSSVAAHDLFIEGLKLTLAKDSAVPAMPLMQKALAIGLSAGDEVEARMCVAEGYRQIFGTSGLPEHKMVETIEFQQCITQIEKTIELDRTHSLNFFSKPLNIGRLKNLDIMYTLVCEAKQKQEGTAASIAYLVTKLAAVDYLRRPPLLESLLELARLYRKVGSFEDAARCLHKILDTEPLYPADRDRHEKLCATAQQMLNEI